MNRTSRCWACQPNNPRSFVSQKKLLVHLLLSTRSSFYRSYSFACRLLAHARWPSKAQRTAVGLARHSALQPSSHSARLAALPGMAHCCPLQLARLRPPRRSCDRCLPSAMCSHCRRLAAYKRRQAISSGEHHTPTSLHSAKQLRYVG
jgi:hypothetical protein